MISKFSACCWSAQYDDVSRVDVLMTPCTEWRKFGLGSLAPRVYLLPVPHGAEREEDGNRFVWLAESCQFLARNFGPIQQFVGAQIWAPCPASGNSSRGSTWAPCPGTCLNKFRQCLLYLLSHKLLPAPTKFVADFTRVKTFSKMFVNCSVFGAVALTKGYQFRLVLVPRPHV